MPKGRGLLIYNPTAGGRDRRAGMFGLMDRAERAGLSLMNLPTERAGHATELVTRHLSEGPDVVAVCGGDGTIGEAAEALLGTATPLAVLPAGTANVVAREYGIGLDLRAAERIMLSDRTRPLTAFRADSHSCLVCVGVGFDARVMGNAVPILKRLFGRAGIGYTATLEWAKYEFPRILVEGVDAEDRPFEREATFVLAANVSRYGGNPILSPYANPESDLLELVLFTSRSRLTLMSFYNLISKGKAAHLSVEGVSRFQVKHFTARSAAGYELEVQVDGDLSGTTPITVGPARGQIRVVVPE